MKLIAAFIVFAFGVLAIIITLIIQGERKRRISHRKNCVECQTQERDFDHKKTQRIK